MSAPAICAGCGRPIASASAARCPVCGTPVRRAGAAGASMGHRPDEAVPLAEPDPLPPTRSAPSAGGRICPACGHPNAHQRIRCESCAEELRAGEASPQPPPRAQPPRIPPPPAPNRWPLILAIVGVVLVMIALYLVAYAIV